MKEKYSITETEKCEKPDWFISTSDEIDPWQFVRDNIPQYTAYQTVRISTPTQDKSFIITRS